MQILQEQISAEASESESLFPVYPHSDAVNQT